MVIHLCEAMNFVLGLPTFWYWGPSLGNVEPNLLKSLKRIYYQIWMCFTREFWRRHLPPIRLKVSWLWRRHSHQIWMYFTHGLMSLFRRHLDVFYHPIRMHFTWRFVTLWRRHFPSYLDEFYPWFDVFLSPPFGCILPPILDAFYPKFRGSLALPFPVIFGWILPMVWCLFVAAIWMYFITQFECILPEVSWLFGAAAGPWIFGTGFAQYSCSSDHQMWTHFTWNSMAIWRIFLHWNTHICLKHLNWRFISQTAEIALQITDIPCSRSSNTSWRKGFEFTGKMSNFRVESALNT